MVIISCPIVNCPFKTEDLSEGNAGISLNIHGNTYTSESREPAQTIAKTERMQRSTVSTEITLQKWSYFVWNWELYKKHTNIGEGNISTELLACCDDNLRSNLFRANNTIHTSTENDILEAIKSFAVKSESFVVAQVNHLKMRQGRDEPIRKFAARLKGQASICEYNTEAQCKCGEKPTVNYGDKVMRQIIAANIEDSEIQKDLLSALNNKESQMTVEQVIDFIEARENGRESALKLSSYQNQTLAPASSFKKNIRSQNKTYSQAMKPNNSKEKCMNCGLFGHGNHWGLANAHIRKKLGCPAYGKQCNKCQRMGHLSSACRTTTNPTTTAATEEQKAQEDYMVGGAVGIYPA